MTFRPLSNFASQRACQSLDNLVLNFGSSLSKQAIWFAITERQAHCKLVGSVSWTLIRLFDFHVALFENVLENALESFRMSSHTLNEGLR